MWPHDVNWRTVRRDNRDRGRSIRSKYFIVRYHRRGRSCHCQSVATLQSYIDSSCVCLGVRKQRQAKVLWTRHRGYVSFFFFFFLTVRPSDDCDKKNVFSSRDIDYNPQRIVRITNTKLHTGQSHLVTDSANKNVKRPSTTCDALQLAWKYCRRCHI